MVMTNESSRLEHTIMILITTDICSIMQYLHYGTALSSTGFQRIIGDWFIIYYFYIHHNSCFKEVYCSAFVSIILRKLNCSIYFHKNSANGKKHVQTTFSPQSEKAAAYGVYSGF